MRVLERITVAVFAVVLLVFCGYKGYTRVAVDRTPPSLLCATDEIEVSVNASEEELLRGVTAMDNRDGDLSASVMIKGITQLITDNTARITYVVFDRANNMATCQRTIRYTDYEKPHFSLNRPLIYTVGETISILDRLTAMDSGGSDITENIRIVSQNVSRGNPGNYTVSVQVSNSQGDIDTLQLPVIITSGTSVKPLVQMENYVVYLERGASFDPYSYITLVCDKEGNTDVPSNVTVENDVDTGRADTYYVAYKYLDYTVFLTVVIM